MPTAAAAGAGGALIPHLDGYTRRWSWIWSLASALRAAFTTFGSAFGALSSELLAQQPLVLLEEHPVVQSLLRSIIIIVIVLHVRVRGRVTYPDAVLCDVPVPVLFGVLHRGLSMFRTRLRSCLLRLSCFGLGSPDV